MKQSIFNLLHRVVPSYSPESGPDEAPADPRTEILQEIEAARTEWKAASAYFEVVTDPNLIDHAIATLDAAEKKYMFLLRRAREEGITVQHQPVEF